MKLDQAKLLFNEKRSLTQAVVSVVSQAEPVVARAPVVSWDVDALVDTTSIVFGHTFVYICREKMQENVKASSRQLFETHTRQRNAFIYLVLGDNKKNQYQWRAKKGSTAKLSV